MTPTATAFLIQTTTVPTKHQRRKTTLTAMDVPMTMVPETAAAAMAMVQAAAALQTLMATVSLMTMIPARAPLQVIPSISSGALTLKTAAAMEAVLETTAAMEAVLETAAAPEAAVPLRTAAFQWAWISQPPWPWI